MSVCGKVQHSISPTDFNFFYFFIFTQVLMIGTILQDWSLDTQYDNMSYYTVFKAITNILDIAKCSIAVSIPFLAAFQKTLGTLCVTKGVFDLKQGIELSSHVISDKQAVEACLAFAGNHGMLVEPSCGATLAAGYSGIIQELKESNVITRKGPIVFIVCGGNLVSIDSLMEWKKQFQID